MQCNATQRNVTQYILCYICSVMSINDILFAFTVPGILQCVSYCIDCMLLYVIPCHCILLYVVVWYGMSCNQMKHNVMKPTVRLRNVSQCTAL